MFISQFTNYADLSFSKCKGTSSSRLSLFNADLGKTKFNDFEWNSFNEIRIDNSQLDEIKASSVQWFEDKQLSVGMDSQSEEVKFRGRREVYRQLKKALKTNGNQIDSLEFQAREMRAYRNELKKRGRYSCPDRVIMCVSMSNNYGLSWWKPTWIIALITFAFYLLMLPLFSNNINYTPACSFEEVKITFMEVWNNFHVFWQLFNPTRKFSNVYGAINSAWLHFLDLFQRLLLGIFIFQIIKGFRRFVSK